MPLRPHPRHRRTNRREAHRPSALEKYLSVLEMRRVAENQRQWYMRTGEAFVEAVQPTRMGDVSAGQITRFIHGHGREQRFSERQLRQGVDTVQLLLAGLAFGPGATEKGSVGISAKP